MFASLASSLYAYRQSGVSPNPFGCRASVKLVVIAATGGLASDERVQSTFLGRAGAQALWLQAWTLQQLCTLGDTDPGRLKRQRKR